MSDLWSCDRTDIRAAVIEIMSGRGRRVREVFPLSSGLYVHCRIESGRVVSISDTEVRAVIWRKNKREGKPQWKLH